MLIWITPILVTVMIMVASFARTYCGIIAMIMLAVIVVMVAMIMVMVAMIVVMVTVIMVTMIVVVMMMETAVTKWF